MAPLLREQPFTSIICMDSLSTAGHVEFIDFFLCVCACVVNPFEFTMEIKYAIFLSALNVILKLCLFMDLASNSLLVL